MYRYSINAKIGSKRTNFRLLPMLLRLFRPFILSIQNNQNHNQRCESHAGSHPPLAVIPPPDNRGNSTPLRTAHTGSGRYVVDVVALGASRRKDGRIRDRGNMVAADRTCQNRSRHDRKAVHIFSANHRKCNRKQNTEGTPGRTGRERQPAAMTNIRPASGSRPAHCRPLPLDIAADV